MLCDELKDYDYDPDFPFQSRGRFYDADEVEAAIAELKQKLKDVNELIKTARQKLEDAKATAYAGVDAGMRKRRLRRALYKACANWAFLAQWERGELVENWEKWENVERKCREKAEEYR